MVRRGARRVRLRPAGLGASEGVWRSQRVRRLAAFGDGNPGKRWDESDNSCRDDIG